MSLHRPWTRGAVWLPEGAPRIPISPPPGPLAAPRYPIKEWSYTHGFGYYYAASGWAQYDSHFVQWAEREGYAFDMITQTDLHYRPEILAALPLRGDRRARRILVLRDALDDRGHVEQGGHLARFGGNFVWQIRLEGDGRRQVCYKHRASAEDPVRGHSGRAAC